MCCAGGNLLMGGVKLESHIKDLGTGTRQDGIPFSLVSLVIGDSHIPVKFSLRNEPLRNEWACRLRTRRLGLDQQPVNDANHDLATSAAARIVTSCNSYPGIDSHLELLDKRGPSYLPLAINKPQISWACRSRQPLVEVDSREITVPITVPTSFRIGYSTWWNGLQLGRVAACARVVGVVGRQKGPLPVAPTLCMHISPKRIHRIERARVPSAHSSQITEV